jgi:hypothetical protein
MQLIWQLLPSVGELPRPSGRGFLVRRGALQHRLSPSVDFGCSCRRLIQDVYCSVAIAVHDGLAERACTLSASVLVTRSPQQLQMMLV